MEHNVTQVGIIGAGELGRAIGNALTTARLQVLYYDTDTTRSTTGSMEDLVVSCQILLLCVPSWATKDVIKQLSKAAHPQQNRLVISLAKGVEPGFITMDTLLRDQLPSNYDTGVIYGPMIASEIARGRSSFAIMTLTNTHWFRPLREHFADAHIYVQLASDPQGVALCAVLKNVYAIGFGLLDGLQAGANMRGAMMVQVLHEMKRLLIAKGGKPHTVEGIAGLGDAIATGLSEESFNYRVGKSLAECIADEHIKSEGLMTLHELHKHVDLAQYPVAQAINNIAFHYAEPQTLADTIIKLSM